MLLPAALLIFFLNHHALWAEGQKGQVSMSENLPAQRFKRFIKHAGVSGRFIPKERSTPATNTTVGSPEGKSAAKKPDKRPPATAAPIGGRGSYSGGEETQPEKPPMGRTLSRPQFGGRGPMTNSPPESHGRMTPPQRPPPTEELTLLRPPSRPPMGRSMDKPPPYVPPPPSIWGSLEIDPEWRGNPAAAVGDDTDGATLDIGADIAANLCALQDEFEATGSPPKHTLPDPRSTYLAKYKIKGDQQDYKFKWTPCAKKGDNGKPCGWYELTRC